jgi:hypothetical protein
MSQQRVGLCASCLHATVQKSAKGQTFWRCRLADEDERFLRYPPLPVSACSGFCATASKAPGTRAEEGED